MGIVKRRKVALVGGKTGEFYMRTLGLRRGRILQLTVHGAPRRMDG
jgi:hypothetical protein